MKRTNNKAKVRLNQKGQGIMEYLILTSLIGIFCIMAVSDLGKKTKDRIEKVKKKIVQVIDIDV